MGDEINDLLDNVRLEMANALAAFDAIISTSTAARLEYYLAQNELLIAMALRHRRHLLYVAGKEVPPETHDSGVIHLLPAVGGF